MNNIVRPVIATHTPTVPSDLRKVPEGVSSCRPRGPEWIGSGSCSAGIPELTAPEPSGRVMEAGAFRGRRCGPEFIGRRCSGLPVIDSPAAYTAPAVFGEIGRMVTL